MIDPTLAIVAISVMAPMISIILYSIFKERADTRKIDYRKWKARFDNRNPKKKAPPAPPESKGIGGLLAGLDTDKISGILEALQDNTYADEDKADNLGDLLGNPAIQAAIQGFLKPKKQQEEQQEEIKYL